MEGLHGALLTLTLTLTLTLIGWKALLESLSDSRRGLAMWKDGELWAAMQSWRAYTVHRERRIMLHVASHMANQSLAAAFFSWRPLRV